MLRKKRNITLTLLTTAVILVLLNCNQQPHYLNPDLPVDQRVEDLVSRMTVEEKISQMSHLAPGIERLGVQAYDPNFKNPLWLTWRSWKKR